MWTHVKPFNAHFEKNKQTNMIFWERKLTDFNILFTNFQKEATLPGSNKLYSSFILF